MSIQVVPGFFLIYSYLSVLVSLPSLVPYFEFMSESDAQAGILAAHWLSESDFVFQNSLLCCLEPPSHMM